MKGFGTQVQGYTGSYKEEAGSKLAKDDAGNAHNIAGKLK